MRFEALKARYGDCLFLTFDGAMAGAEPTRLLVDGGPGTVFQNALKTRLEAELRAHPDEAPVTLDAVLVSHIDEDHILGILDLLEEVRDDRSPGGPLCEVRWLFHNSFDALIGEGEGGAARNLQASDVLAAVGTSMGGLQGVSSPDPSALLVLQSYGQGSRLASLAAAMKIRRNPPDAAVLMFDGVTAPVRRLGPATLTFFGPLQAEVEALRRKWATEVKKPDGRAALAAYLDKSIPNLSSLVVLVEQNDVSILLTGDARGDKILDGLRAGGRLGGVQPLKVDILKLPHHGSSRNLDDDFFQAIHADHYVVSGDGTHGNPDRETLQMLERARPDGGFVVHLTYSAAHCDQTHRDWKQARQRSFDPAQDGISDIIDRWKKSPSIEVREDVVSIQLPGDAPPRPHHPRPRPISDTPRPVAKSTLRPSSDYKLKPGGPPRPG